MPEYLKFIFKLDFIKRDLRTFTAKSILDKFNGEHGVTCFSKHPYGIEYHCDNGLTVLVKEDSAIQIYNFKDYHLHACNLQLNGNEITTIK